MKKEIGWMLAVVLVGMMQLAQGAELGREALAPASGPVGLGRGPLAPAQVETGTPGGTWGLKLGLGWAHVKWNVGSADGSESVFAPQGSLFYKATDNLDVNLSAMFLSAKDQDSVLGDTKAGMTRLALGARYWFQNSSRVTPYLGGGIGYYLLSGGADKTRDATGAAIPANVGSMKDTPGAFLEGGLAFHITDNFYLNADLTYDFLLGSSDVKINGNNESFDVKSFSVNLGVMWTF